jgi:predicted O-methyltransferase YrrM
MAYMNNEYLNRAETAAVVSLINSVSPKVVMEFGTNRGKTAKAILEATPSIELYIGIDVPWGFRTRLDGQLSEVPMTIGLFALTDSRYQILIRESTTLFAEELELIDAAFIDGDHSVFAVEHDSHLARELLRPGGIIVWHDYGNPAVEVTKALDHLIAEGWPIHRIEGTWLAYMHAPTIQQDD